MTVRRNMGPADFMNSSIVQQTLALGEYGDVLPGVGFANVYLRRRGPNHVAAIRRERRGTLALARRPRVQQFFLLHVPTPNAVPSHRHEPRSVRRPRESGLAPVALHSGPLPLAGRGVPAL